MLHCYIKGYHESRDFKKHMCLWLLWSVSILVPGDGTKIKKSTVKRFKCWEKNSSCMCFIISCWEKGFKVKDEGHSIYLVFSYVCVCVFTLSSFTLFTNTVPHLSLNALSNVVVSVLYLLMFLTRLLYAPLYGALTNHYHCYY